MPSQPVPEESVEELFHCVPELVQGSGDGPEAERTACRRALEAAAPALRKQAREQVLEEVGKRLKRELETAKMRLASWPPRSIGRSAAAGEKAGLEIALREVAAIHHPDQSKGERE